jgi:CRP-like cAMP-binding protein
MLPEPFNLLPAEALPRIEVPAGTAVFRQDDSVRGPYLLISGTVEMVRHTEAGHRIVLHQAHASETLAEASLFSDRYHCACIASRDSTLILLDKAVVLDRMKRDAGFALALLKRMASQVQCYRRQIEILAIRGAEDRVLAALDALGQTGSVMDFAARIGLSHEATYRALSALTRRGIVERTGRGRYRIRS